MLILSSSADKRIDLRRPIVTVGSFDGVHLAHRAILQVLNSRAKEVDGTSLVVTFEPHPRVFLDPQEAPLLLTSKGEKLAILDDLSLDAVYLLPFNSGLAKMGAEQFVEKVLHNRLNTCEVVIGHDHHFGKGRRGGLATLQELGALWGFQVTALDPVLHHGQPISSTRIRRSLLAGDVKPAAEMLGYQYRLAGNVVQGDGRGRSLNYPTANLKVPARKLIPENGVYAVSSCRDGPNSHGLLNIGHRPTFGGRDRLVEIHFFDFDDTLYGKEIEIQFVDKIRDEIKFSNSAELTRQIRKDEQVARRLLETD